MTSRTRRIRRAQASFFTYVAGFVFSLLTTLVAFWGAIHLGAAALPEIIAAALLQLLIQMKFFLHLGNESERPWLTVGGFSLVVIGIVLGGTLWIMHNLMRLHMHAPSTGDLYEHGIVAPQYELK